MNKLIRYILIVQKGKISTKVTNYIYDKIDVSGISNASRAVTLTTPKSFIKFILDRG